MKKVWVSNRTEMVLQSLDNIDVNHKLYNTFYEKEVDDCFHVNVRYSAVVYDNARVFNNAIVYGDALIRGNAIVEGMARVYDNAIVDGNVIVDGISIVADDAVVTKNTINITGLPHNVTLTDNHIRIGWKQFTFDYAKKLAERNIDIDADAYNKMIKHKDLLLTLIKERENDKW